MAHGKFMTRTITLSQEWKIKNEKWKKNNIRKIRKIVRKTETLGVFLGLAEGAGGEKGFKKILSQVGYLATAPSPNNPSNPCQFFI